MGLLRGRAPSPLGGLGWGTPRIGAVARSRSDCLLVADAGGELIGYVWAQDLGAQMRQAETMRFCAASAVAVGIAPNV